ncbi:MAG: amino acid permease [Alphaproteobacteria bacterium]|nr:amino acid permease [Alphaproteobacteria bacterium]
MDKFKIGPFRATALVSGNMIGSGVLLAPALLAPYGQMSLIGWILTTIGALALALVFSKLAIWIPNSGGPYTYVKHVFGDFVGFQMAWGYWISSWCGSVSLLVGTLQYISVFAPEFAANTTYSMIFGLSMIWLFTYFNIRGLKETTFVGIIVFLIKVVPLVLIAFVGIFYADFSRVFAFDKCDWSSLGSMAPVLLWAFIGLESATIPSEDVRTPNKTIPVATIAGVLITAAIYIMGAIVITGVLPQAELIKSAAPYVDSATKIFGNPGYLFMIITGIIGLVGSLNGWILIQGQVPYAAAKEGLFPSMFLKKNENGVPRGVLIGSILMSIMFILNHQESLVQNLRLFIDISVLAMLLPYFYSVIAYGYLAVTKKNELSNKEKFFMPIIGLIAFLYSFIAIVGAEKELVYLCFLIFLASVPFYCFIKKR